MLFIISLSKKAFKFLSLLKRDFAKNDFLTAGTNEIFLEVLPLIVFFLNDITVTPFCKGFEAKGFKKAGKINGYRQ
jgi:hypothetical protein